MKKNNLPDNWLVRNDGSQLFKDTVIAYLNDEFNIDLVGLNTYYGIVDSNLVNTQYTNLECILSLKEFIELSKPINMIDFKVKGTRLPVITKNTEYRTETWNYGVRNCKLDHSISGLVSFGPIDYKDELYILAGKPSSSYQTLYMFKEYDIVNLAEEQGIFKNNAMEKEIIGYKCPMDLYGGNIENGTLYKPLASKNNISYAAFSKKGYVLSSSFNMPKEIVETWEPVFRIKKPSIEKDFDLKFYDDHVIAGRTLTKIDAHQFIEADNFVESFNSTLSIKISEVTIEEFHFNKDEVKQISDYYKELWKEK